MRVTVDRARFTVGGPTSVSNGGLSEKVFVQIDFGIGNVQT